MVLVIRRRHILISVCCCVLVAGLAFAVNTFRPDSTQTSSANTNWGLSFPIKNEPPVGNATSDFLRQYNSFFLGDTSCKKIHLTFDAGYENGYTPQILDTLKKHGVKATFFIVGNYIKTSPGLVRRMAEEGHIVGNHTFSHPDMSKISDMTAFKKEICSLEEIFSEVTGSEMQKFYRPPQGKYSEENLKQANELGYKTVFWSLAYVDWLTDKQPSREYAFEKLSKIHPGAIVLLHSTSRTNAEILDELLTKWKDEGYTFGSLGEIN